MNSKGTFYLTVLALGVFAYIFFFERHTFDTEQRAERKMKLFPDFDAAKVTGVDIILRSTNVIHVDRTNDQWSLTGPNYPAQSTVIENWLGLFHSLNRRAYISAEELLAEPRGLATFGLEEPQATVIIQQGQKKLQLLQNERVDQFVSDTAGNDPEPYGLQTPEVVLTLGQGTNPVLAVEFGKSPTNNPAQVYARRSNYYSTITTVPRQLLDLLRAP